MEDKNEEYGQPIEANYTFDKRSTIAWVNSLKPKETEDEYDKYPICPVDGKKCPLIADDRGNCKLCKCPLVKDDD